MIDMRMDSIKIRQLHVVAIDAAQMMVVVMGHRERNAFELMLRQREDIFSIARIMIGKRPGYRGI